MAGVSGKEEYQALLNRTEKYARQVRKLFAKAVNDILALTTTVPHLDDGEVFSYSKQKKIEKEVSDRLRELHSAVYAAIKNDIALEWEEANNACDELAISCFGKRVLSDEQLAGWFERNTEAMDAFISRSEAGLTLSDRIWQPVKQLRSEMELAMTVAIGDGDSASQISRYVRKYLNNPDKLFRRIRDEKGNLKLSKAAEAYHPGQGVYRSSAKNAMRIARTETNIAYRRADNTRWQQMDFVLGQEVRLSRSHPVTDICDTLAGKYPKDFVFDGWHPQCFCFVTPILLSEEEMVDLRRAKMNGEAYDLSGKTITDVPDNFKSWVRDNKDRIAAAERKDKLPYFIKNNRKKVEGILKQNPKEQPDRSIKRNADKPQNVDMEVVRQRRKEIRKRLGKNTNNDFAISVFDRPISLSNSSVKEWLNQPHAHIAEKNELILDIKNVLEKSTYIGHANDRHNSSIKVHLFETKIKGDKSWIIIRELPNGQLKLHSISDNESITSYLIK